MARKRKRENLRRRKNTLVKKAWEIGHIHGIDVALILRQNGRYFTYRSIDQDSWPLSIERIVRQNYLSNVLNMLRPEQKVLYPVLTNMLPQDIESLH